MVIIQERLGQQNYETWFKESKAIPSNDDFIIEVKDHFALNWIKHNYIDFISDIIKKVTGNLNNKLVFAVKKDDGSHYFENNQEKETIDDSHLNPSFTFDHYIIGDFNRLAASAAMEVAKSPGNNPYNPLYIHGGVGLGKTHLLQSIGHLIKKLAPSKNVVYVTAEHYMDEFVGSILSNSVNDFKSAYRGTDVLLIDDVQFFEGKESTQEQFFHLFNALHQNGKQVVLTSEIPPSKLKGLAERLRSRFNWGLVVDLKPPGLEGRIQILKSKMERVNTVIPDDVISYLAENITTNIRALEGSLIRLLAQVSLTGMDINLETVQGFIKQYETTNTNKSVSIPTIIDLVCEEFGISRQEMLSKSRIKRIATARHIAMYLSRTMTDASLSYIGLAIGNRDHSTVHHSFKKIDKLIDTDKNMARTIEKIRGLCAE